MHAEWSAECSSEAAVLVVPWSDADAGAHFVNLRTEPYSIAEIPEAERFPDLARALRALNANRSPFLTAKCDAWPLSVRDSAEDLELMRKELMLEADEATYAFTSYIDLLWRERAIFASAHQQQDRLDRLARRATKLVARRIPCCNAFSARPSLTSALRSKASPPPSTSRHSRPTPNWRTAAGPARSKTSSICFAAASSRSIAPPLQSTCSSRASSSIG